MHGDTVSISGVTAAPVGDITTQTQQVLERIDAALQPALRTCLVEIMVSAAR